MINQKPVVFCRDCIYSAPEPKFEWNLHCHQPDVNRFDSWALSSPLLAKGTEAYVERAKRGWGAACGIHGKKFVAKEEA